MRAHIFILVLTIALFSLCQAQRQSPTAFTPQAFENEPDADEEYDAQAQTNVGYRARLYDYNSGEEEQEEQPQQIYHTRRQQQQQAQQSYKKDNKHKPTETEEIEEEEPDRLTVLLQKSGFNCDSKTTGYYADDTLGCEVFHYCQDNQKHSWICPEGFSFHQVHLICMPPSGENICEESSKYHIVNEYLYKPINVEEHQTKPNISLKYSERYYPETFYHDERQDYQEDRIQSHRQPIQVGFHSQQRKAPTPTASPSPLPYRFATQQPQTVFRSPEEINISLQQRRPQLFVGSSTPKYNNDDEYGYEK